MEKKFFKLEVIKRERTNSKGNKFNTYAVKVGEKWQTLKFTKEVETKDMPIKHSYMKVLKENITEDNRDKYPVYWVKAIEELEVIPSTPKDLSGYFEEC